jgi:isoamylase
VPRKWSRRSSRIRSSSSARLVSAAFEVEVGSAHPFGVTVRPDGVNFSLFSESATEVVLLLFEHAAAVEPTQTIRLDPFANKTFHFWHVFVRGCAPGMLYAFRIDGPDRPEAGDRFNPNKILLSPYARGISKELWKRGEAIGRGDNLAASMRGIVVDPSGYDWEGDKPLNRPIHEAVIYELHVGGYTRSSTAKVKHPGTFAGLIEKIPHLKSLGVTAVELMPVFEFDDSDLSMNAWGDPVRNFWGYSTVAFFSPHSGYCVHGSGLTQLNEFRDLVKAFHKAGIEVILDVVFNHTDEGNECGPTFSFRGIDNRTFYLLDPQHPARYLNFTGVGNTFNANHPVPQKFIVDCLRYWVQEAHVDGFRFDEGSILSRGEDGAPLTHPPVIWQIELDDTLANTKVIAEAWDAAGLYQVGHFPGDRWAEWNGRFRDEVRRFVKGDPGLTGAIASRLGGSADIYDSRDESPINSINFITAHDGFTINDLVSFNSKHNEANGEGNRDGVNDNHSWNCGIEGSSDDPAIELLRARQIRNLFTMLLLARGVPMLLGGDEIRRTQRGNNNAYNQDNAISWIDWGLATKHHDILRFVQRMIAFRKAHPALWQPVFYTGALNERGLPDIVWHGTKLGSPGFDDPDGRALACTIAGIGDSPDLHVMMNMFWEPLDFEVPTYARWRTAIDTFASSPNDIADSGAQALVIGGLCTVRPRSIIVLRTDTDKPKGDDRP